jgi:hypothetical protein
MEPLKAVPLQSGKSVEFKPGGNHVMLFDLPPRSRPAGDRTDHHARQRRQGTTKAKVVAPGAQPGRPRRRHGAYGSYAGQRAIMVARKLTPGEAALGRSVYGAAIDWHAVEGGAALVAVATGDVVMAPMGHIHFHPAPISGQTISRERLSCKGC